jgi:4-amino-4-deoxy-L-arabinose transferase-like glycosyltransferase
MSALLNLLSALGILLYCAIVTTRVYCFTSKWTDTDPSLRFGLAGLTTLGTLGTLFLFVGLVSTAAIPIVAIIVLIAALAPPKPLFSEITALYNSFKTDGPRGTEWIFLATIKLCEIIVMIGVLAPPNMQEWDSLAYHLAVPKLWLTQGHITYIPYIHQSNFPGAFDYLYLLGLSFGYAGAKAFVYVAAKFGGLAIFGLARQLYGRQAAWWATLAYATVPVILWLSGTAYIDVPNGLAAGLGIAMVALYCKTNAKKHLLCAAIMLGIATASKYTGLQTIGAVGFMLLIVGIRRKQVASYFGNACLLGILALLIASPWYIKNAINTGNPVYPFFSSKLGGKNWSAPQAEEYSREQASFGVGRNALGHLDPTQIGHAVLGLAYQPGRYINPAQQVGGGTPIGAIGVVVLCAMLAWALSGKSQSFELFSLGAIGVSLLLWFFLSQQSRYIVTLAIPLAVMFGGGATRLRAGPWLQLVCIGQAIYSIVLLFLSQTTGQLAVVGGLQSERDYYLKRVDFEDAAVYINQNVPKSGRVALYDVVFGYLLDVPYYWANPGHSNEIPYSNMKSGHDLVSALRNMGFTHVYVKLSADVRPPEENAAWMAAMGLQGPPQPFPPAMQEKYNLNSFEQRYVPLIADAVAHGELRPVQGFRSGILFELTARP